MTFTTQKPTLPGAYWWRRCSSKVELANVRETPAGLWAFFSDGESGFVDDIGCEWSSRLVPVDEVETAYREGWNYALSHGSHSQEQAWLVYSRVVEGREV